jgi:hypothetical protein
LYPAISRGFKVVFATEEIEIKIGPRRHTDFDVFASIEYSVGFEGDVCDDHDDDESQPSVDKGDMFSGIFD